MAGNRKSDLSERFLDFAADIVKLVWCLSNDFTVRSW